MPTGYTYKIGEGISFEDFVLLCARQFGACIMQRDDNANDKPKLQKPSDHYEKKLKKYIKYKKPTKTDFKKYVNKSIKELEKDNKNKTVLRKKYENMLKNVKSWQPPTSDHTNLKQFMIDQIAESIDFDCNNNYNDKEIKRLDSLTYESYCKDEENSFKKMREYYAEELSEEKKRVDSRNNWIISLYNSLGLKVD